MLKRLLPLAALVFWPCYSYSESIQPYFGTTGNAADAGHQWVMDNILPDPPGLDLNGVFYSYTPDKLTEDEFKVTVGNENVWSDTEDWTGTPGGIEVRKVIGLPDVPREAFGDGYIETEGTGTINDPMVVYSYKVDPCFDPQFDPNCPGYVVPVPKIEEFDLSTLYDVTQDDNVDLDNIAEEDKYEDDETLTEEELAEKEAEEEKDSEDRLEKALSAVDNSELFAQAFAASQLINTMNNAVNMNSYAAATIPGGTYKEDVKLIDNKIDDNKNGLRNGLAQQILHEEMINMQYTN